MNKKISELRNNQLDPGSKEVLDILTEKVEEPSSENVGTTTKYTGRGKEPIRV